MLNYTNTSTDNQAVKMYQNLQMLKLTFIIHCISFIYITLSYLLHILYVCQYMFTPILHSVHILYTCPNKKNTHPYKKIPVKIIGSTQARSNPTPKTKLPRQKKIPHPFSYIPILGQKPILVHISYYEFIFLLWVYSFILGYVSHFGKVIPSLVLCSNIRKPILFPTCLE